MPYVDLEKKLSDVRNTIAMLYNRGDGLTAEIKIREEQVMQIDELQSEYDEIGRMLELLDQYKIVTKWDVLIVNPEHNRNRWYDLSEEDIQAKTLLNKVDNVIIKKMLYDHQKEIRKKRNLLLEQL